MPSISYMSDCYAHSCSHHDLCCPKDICADAICELQVSLTRINVAHNHLTDLPEAICELVTLEKIECGDNRVRSVPNAVSKLTRLALLSLKNNNLRRLPDALGKCAALKSLSLNANDLVALPDSLCDLQNLKRLTSAANKLHSLPWHMGEMGALKTLDFSSNPLICLPPSLGLLIDTLEKVELFECSDLRDPPAPIVDAGHGRIMVQSRHDIVPVLVFCLFRDGSAKG